MALSIGLVAALGALLLDGGTRLFARHAAGSLLLLLGTIGGASFLLVWMLLLGSVGLLAWPWIAAGAIVLWIAGRLSCVRSPLPRIAARLAVVLRPERGRRLRALAAWTCVAVTLVCAVQALRDPNLDYDAVSYHLPYTAAVLDSGRITHVDTPFGDNAQAYQPKNDDLLRVALAPVRGEERLAWVGSFPHLPLLLLSVYLGARAIGARRRGALLGATVTLVAPVLADQARSALVDLALASWWSAFLALALAARARKAPALALGAGLALGLAYGTKYLAVPYTPLALAVGSVAVLGQERGARLRAFVLLATGALLTGAFFYVRNWAWSGSPVFPIEVRLFGHGVFEGDYGSETMRAWKHCYANRDDWPLALRIGAYVMPLCGILPLGWFGPQLTTCVVLSVALPAALLVASLVAARGRVEALVAAIAPLALALCWWIVPYTYGRFALLGIAALGIACARLGALAAGAALLQCLLCARSDVALATALAAPCVLLAHALRARARLTSRWLVPALGVTCAVAVLAARRQTAGEALARAAQGLTAAATETGDDSPDLRESLAFLHAAPAGAVAYAGHNLPYLARGEGARRIGYVACDGANLRYDQRSAAWRAAGLPQPTSPEPGLYRHREDAVAWFEAVQVGGYEYVWVAAMNPAQLTQVRHDARGFPAELAWAYGAAPALEPVVVTEGACVFRVRRGVPPAAALPAPTLRSEPDLFSLLDRPQELIALYPRAPWVLAKAPYARYADYVRGARR